MKKVMENTIILALVYIMITGLLPLNILDTNVNAATTIPSYLKVESGYATNVHKYKDKTIISDPESVKYYSGDKLKKSGYGGFNAISDKEVIIYKDNKRQVFNIEKEELGKDITALELKLEKIIRSKYNIQNDGYVYIRTFKKSIDGIWSSFSSHDYQSGRSANGLIREDGKIIEYNELEDVYFEAEYISENEIVLSWQNYKKKELGITIIDKNTGKKISENIIKNNDPYDHIMKITKTKIWVARKVKDSNLKVNIDVYSYDKNKINKVRTINNLPNQYSGYYDIDSKENLWYVENGDVKKVEGDKIIIKYKVDKRMNAITVYDDNHIVVTGYDHLKNWSGYTIINNNSNPTESNDWKNNWASKEIKYAMDKGWVEAREIFRPEDSITRAEFIKIVNKAFGFKAKANSESFTDVDSKQWWYNEVLIALKAGYISSKNTTFRPNDKITREEVAAIVTSIKNNKDTNLDKIKKYKDFNKVSDWAQTSVEGAIEAKYMGVNSDMFNPKQNITRAQSVVTLYRIVK